MPDPIYTHLIRLYPQGNYFFGGENYSDSEQRAFYFQKSRKFPQQTTLLGLIRYQLLLQNGLLEAKRGRKHISSKAAAGLLIGENSFVPHPKESNQVPSFGAIEALSPVMLIHEDGKQFAPFPAFKDWEAESKWSESEFRYHSPSFLKTDVSLRVSLHAGNRLSELPSWQKYDVKKGTEWGYRSLDGKSFLSQKAVFQKVDPQIGIYKHQKLAYRQKGEQREREGFFKMNYCRLKEKFGFGIYLRLDPLQEIQLDSQAAVVMGKERSVFKMEVERLLSPPAQLPSPEPELLPGSSICLSSPARIDLPKVYESCQAAITRESSFRCITSSVAHTDNYHGRPTRNDPKGNPGLSARFNLLGSGSLLVLKNDLSSDALKQLSKLLHDPIFSSIGYNHYLTT